jgi:Uma2 family endonuclease
MAEPARRTATYEDLCALGSHVVGEIVHGVLHASPRPSPRHARASSTLGEELGPPFNRGRGGPGGWLILDEPELHLDGHVLVPDLAGWRRERLPELPIDKAYFDLAPDWLCEILSPSTAALDRGDKRRLYGEQGVRHLWFVDPDPQTLEIYALDGSSYRLLDVYSGAQLVRAPPFEAVEVELGALWAR